MEARRLLFDTVSLRRIALGKHPGQTDKFLNALAINPTLGQLITHLQYIGDGQPLSAMRLLPYLHQFTNLKNLDGVYWDVSWDSVLAHLASLPKPQPVPLLPFPLSSFSVQLGGPQSSTVVPAAVQIVSLTTLKITSD